MRANQPTLFFNSHARRLFSVCGVNPSNDIIGDRTDGFVEFLHRARRIVGSRRHPTAEGASRHKRPARGIVQLSGQ
jgi:hypothetical protein